MPNLVFDPDGEFDTCPINRTIQSGGGGGLTGAKRCEYVALCKQMTSRDPSLDYTAIRDRILAIMKENVLEHIETLPEADRPTLVADIEGFFSGFDTTDNPLTIINIVGFQISFLFTKYLYPKVSRNENRYFDDPNNDIYNLYSTLIVDDIWKSYSELKPNLGDFCQLQENPDPTTGIPKSTPIFMVFVGFITLGELMESYFDNIFYLGLVYVRDYVDGVFYPPLEVIYHDWGHYSNYVSSSCKKFPVSLNTIKKFHKYVVETEEKSVQYAVNFVLFLLIHEGNCYFFTEIARTILRTKYKNLVIKKQTYFNSFNFKLIEQLIPTENRFILNSIVKDDIYKDIKSYISELSMIQIFGLAVPKAYRIPQKNDPTKLEKEKVLEYINIAASMFVECYRKFITSQKGGYKRQTRKNRGSRKQKYSRRAKSSR